LDNKNLGGIVLGKAGAWLECDHCSGTGATRCPVCVFTEPGQICLSCGGAGLIVCGVCNGTGKVFDRFFDEKGYEKEQEQLRKKQEAEEAKKKKHVQTLLHKMEKAFLLKNKLYQKIIQEIPNIPRSFYVSMNPDKFMSDYRVLFQKLIAIPEGEILISRMLDFTGYKIKLEDLQTGIVERYRKTPPPQVPEAKTAEEFCFLGSRGFRDPRTNVWIHEPMFIEKHQSANGRQRLLALFS
jgi:RecJ-like exonuclease